MCYIHVLDGTQLVNQKDESMLRQCWRYPALNINDAQCALYSMEHVSELHVRVDERMQHQY